VSRQYKALKCSLAIALPLLIAGCAQAIPQASGSIIGAAKYTDVELYARVVNDGTAHGYTVFAERAIEVTVHPDSSARILVTHTSPAGFENASERMRWLAAGKPPFPSALRAGTQITLRADSFSFLPLPPRLSFRQVLALSPAPGKILSILQSGQRMPAGGVRSFYLATQLATLMAIGPVTGTVRHAAWKALMSLPGIRGCTGGRDNAGRSGRWLCIWTPVNELRILLSTTEQKVLCIQNLLTAPSPRYPGVPAGSLLETNTYVTGTDR
jgi:hypothetical protein